MKIAALGCVFALGLAAKGTVKLGEFGEGTFTGKRK
jgi:hypothetical protein